MFVGNFERDAMPGELRSSQSREAWAEFLRQYSQLIFQTCQFSTSDADQAAEDRIVRTDFGRDVILDLSSAEREHGRGGP
jgi:hypothetical protein